MSNSPQQENETARQYVTRLMEEAVALKGEDYVYPQRQPDVGDALGTTCDYIRDGQPSCIVGHVLVAAGVELDELSRHEGGAARSVVPAVAPWDWDEDLVGALNEAQVAQDGGRPWGEALRAFKRMLGIE